MTLQEFLRLTSNVPAPLLRQAMVAALMVEPARHPDAYRRFYCRVLEKLSLAAGADCGAVPAAELAA